MNYGYVAMSQMLFLQLGFIWVAGCAMAYTLAFAIGAKRGGYAALTFTRMLTIVFIGGMVAVAGLAYLSGDFQRFLNAWGFGPLFEMLVLAFGWVAVMWFMAVQYGRGRISLDDKFGSPERRLEAIKMAKEAQNRVFKEAMQAAADESHDERNH